MIQQKAGTYRMLKKYCKEDTATSHGKHTYKGDPLLRISFSIINSLNMDRERLERSEYLHLVDGKTVEIYKIKGVLPPTRRHIVLAVEKINEEEIL